MENRRIASLDVLRGLAVICILFFHSSIFNYDNIHKIDFSNPPILIVLMSFMALWGGLFIVYSSVVNTYMLMHENRRGPDAREYKFLFIAGVFYILLHFLLNFFLGRWTIDFVNNKPDYTAVAGSIRNARLFLPQTAKLFEGSSLSTIGLNLIVLSLIAFLLLKGGGADKQKRNYWVLGLSGSFIMLFSFVRVSIYPLFGDALANNRLIPSLFFSFVMANPYPLLPYVAYGLIGMMIGMMVYHDRKRLLKQVVVPLGMAFLAYGIAGMSMLEKSISKPDYFWYFKTNFELGAFILMFVFSVLVVGQSSWLTDRLSLLKWFSRTSLTVYMLETASSELLRLVALKMLPGWNETINGCLLFGLANILLWSMILLFWSRTGFRYSLEHLWVWVFEKIGKSSEKLSGLKTRQAGDGYKMQQV